MNQPVLTALVFDGAPLEESAVVQVLVRSGCLVQHTSSLVDFQRRAAATSPAVIVLDLGRAGLEIVRDLHRVCENSAIAVLSPYAALRDDVLAAGGWELLDPSDLRALEALAASLRAATRRGDRLETEAPAYPAEPQPET